MTRKHRLALVLLAVGSVIILFQIVATGFSTDTLILGALIVSSAMAAAWGKQTSWSVKLRPVMLVLAVGAFGLFVWAMVNLLKSSSIEISESHSTVGSASGLSSKSEKQLHTTKIATEQESHSAFTAEELKSVNVSDGKLALLRKLLPKNENGKKYLEIYESEAYQEFLKTNPSLNDTVHFFASQGLTLFEGVDVEKILLDAHQRKFPGILPADQDEQMAQKLVEYMSKFGREDGLLAFARDPSSAVWISARFNVANNVEDPSFFDWTKDVTDRLDTSTEITLSEIDTNERSSVFKPPSDLETESLDKRENSSTEGQIPNHHISEVGVAEIENLEQAEVLSSSLDESETAQFSVVRINYIRSVLSQFGFDEGLLQLTETQPDAATWLLEQFDTPESAMEWARSKQRKEPPPAQSELREMDSLSRP